MNLDKEFPVIRKPWKKGQSTVAMVFPNLYRGGAYCFGQLVFYNLINNLEGWRCERRFLDNYNLGGFDLIGFTFQYEPDYFNFLKIMKQNKIILDKTKRQEILFAGGPCVTANPETLAANIDFFLLADAENTLVHVLAAYEETIGKGKTTFLEAIAHMQGVYVPGISRSQTYGTVVLDEASHPLFQPLPLVPSKDLAFGNAFMLEIERSCPYHCSFCSIPRMYSKFQCRSMERLYEIVEQGTRLNRRKKVVIYSPSFTHPQRKELLQFLLDKGLEFSVPSLRVEYVTEDLFPLIKAGGQRTLTIAPECNEALRYSIGKKVNDEVFFAFLKNAQAHSFSTVKLYLLVGLPGQTERDLHEMVQFVQTARSLFRKQVYLSINPFVPKPRLPFAGHVFDKKTIFHQLKYLQRELRGFRVKTADIKNSYLEWRLAHATSFTAPKKRKAPQQSGAERSLLAATTVQRRLNDMQSL